MSPQTWLITGGAGYIGAHVADEFIGKGNDVVIYDSLYRGLESRIEYLRKKHNKEIPLVVADIRDIDKFADTLTTYKPYGIIHTAALKSVGESMEKPVEYFEVNHLATAKMLALIAEHQIKKFIFSSTAAVYGAPDHSNPIREDAPKKPISPYGASKLAAESEVDRFLNLPGNHGTSLRFFNVVGTAAPELLDNSVENLIPIVMSKLRAGESPVIYGTDYPTHDGTCIRDYVDVRDIARAHSAAAEAEVDLPRAMNVGTGSGATVREVINMISSRTDHRNSEIIEAVRRVGDPAILCADVSLIRFALGFICRHSLRASVESL
jgi:UDP-glucose 4-epimerase